MCFNYALLALFLIPFVHFSPILGVDGVAYAGLFADGITFLFATSMWLYEFKKIPKIKGVCTHGYKR